MLADENYILFVEAEENDYVEFIRFSLVFYPLGYYTVFEWFLWCGDY